jgi:hypothetical protein
MNANQFFWNSHWLEIWSTHLCPSMGPNEMSMAMNSAEHGEHTQPCPESFPADLLSRLTGCPPSPHQSTKSKEI